MRHPSWSREYTRTATRPIGKKWLFHIDELSISYFPPPEPPYFFLWMVCRGSAGSNIGFTSLYFSSHMEISLTRRCHLHSHMSGKSWAQWDIDTYCRRFPAHSIPTLIQFPTTPVHTPLRLTCLEYDICSAYNVPDWNIETT